MSAVGWTCFVECSSCRFVQEIPKWQEKQSCPHNEGHNCPGTMLWRASGFRWLLMNQWKERIKDNTCVCQTPVATLRVCKMSGDAVEIGIGEKWTVLEAKRKLAQAISIPVREQCWSFKQRFLHDACLIETLRSADDVLEIFLALRDPKVALWMERITSDWTVVEKQFEQIPKTVWKSSEVILEIMRNSKAALRYADAELLDDAHFLLQACQVRGYKEHENATSPDFLQWLDTVADCQLCLCYSMKQDDKAKAEKIMVHFERIMAKANHMDIATFVVFAFHCDILMSWREHLLTMLKGLSKPALSYGFCSRAVADLDLVRALLPQKPPPGPAAFGDRLLPLLPDSLSAENFALGVLLTHEDKLSSKEFDLCLDLCCKRRDSVPTTEARTLLIACLSRSYEVELLTNLLTWASQEDYKSFVPFILEKDISVFFLANMASKHRASIFQEFLEFWGRPEKIIAIIREDHKKIQSLLRWAIHQGDAAICASNKIRETLSHFVDGDLYETGDAQVGQTLFSLCFAGANLPTNIVETVPLEWFEELMGLRGSEPFLSSTLLLRMEQCEDSAFRDKFPEIWCPVWGNLQEEDCCRAVGLVARWCKLAGLDRDGTAFAIKVLRCLPLNVLSGSSLDIIYSPELPAQAGTIYVTQLLQQNRTEDRNELQKFVEKTNQRFAKLDQDAAQAMNMAQEANARASQAEMAARHAQSEAQSASWQARNAEDTARNAERIARNAGS